MYVYPQQIFYPDLFYSIFLSDLPCGTLVTTVVIYIQQSHSGISHPNRRSINPLGDFINIPSNTN